MKCQGVCSSSSSLLPIQMAFSILLGCLRELYIFNHYCCNLLKFRSKWCLRCWTYPVASLMLRSHLLSCFYLRVPVIFSFQSHLSWVAVSVPSRTLKEVRISTSHLSVKYLLTHFSHFLWTLVLCWFLELVACSREIQMECDFMGVALAMNESIVPVRMNKERF